MKTFVSNVVKILFIWNNVISAQPHVESKGLGSGMGALGISSCCVFSLPYTTLTLLFYLHLSTMYSGHLPSSDLALSYYLSSSISTFPPSACTTGPIPPPASHRALDTKSKVMPSCLRKKAGMKYDVDSCSCYDRCFTSLWRSMSPASHGGRGSHQC